MALTWSRQNSFEIATITKPENITLAVDKSGNYYWNDAPVTNDALLEMLKTAAVKVPQPEVHIRGDRDVRFAPGRR